MKFFDLQKRVAFITGGNGGIGLGMAKGLAGAGVTMEELSEVMKHLAFYTGWPNALTAIGVARDVFEKN